MDEGGHMVVDQGFFSIQHIFQCFGILFEKQDVIHCLFQPPGACVDFPLLIGMGSSQLAPFLLPDGDFRLGYLDHLKLRYLFPHFTKLSKYIIKAGLRSHKKLKTQDSNSLSQPLYVH